MKNNNNLGCKLEAVYRLLKKKKNKTEKKVKEFIEEEKKKTMGEEWSERGKEERVWK